MPNAGNVVVTITARDATSKATKSARTRFQALGQSIQQTSLGQVASFAAVSFAVQKTIGDYANFDKRVREIGTLLDDFDENTIQALGDDIQRMSVEFGQSIDAMAKARYDAISAGFTSIAESSQLLGVASKLAVGGVSDVSRTTDVLTSVLNSYQLRADQAQKVSDLLFTTVRLGKTTVDQLASGLGRAAAIAPTVGVSFEELSAATATLTAGGQSTEEVVTALTATMTALLSPSEALAGRLKDLGFESGTAAVETLGLAETLRRITEGATEADQAAFFPNVRAMRSVFPLTGSLAEKFNQNLEEMQDAAGATDKAFGELSEGVAFRFSQMKARIETASIAIGEALLPLGEAATNIIEAFSSLSTSTIQNFAKIGVSITGALIGIKALTVALGVLGVTLGPTGLLLTGLGLAVGLFTALGGFAGDTGKQITTANLAMQEFGDSVDDLNTSLDETPEKLRDVKDELNNLSVAQLESRLAELERKKLDIQLSFQVPPTPDIELPTFEPQPINFEFGFQATELDAVNQAIDLTEGNFSSASTKINEEIDAINQRLTELKTTTEDAAQATTALAITEDEKKAIAEVAQFREETTANMLMNLVESEIEAREQAKEEALRIEQEKIAEINAANMEAQQQYLALRSDILLTDKEREIQSLADRLTLWNENWAELEEGQQLFTEGLKQINTRYLTDEQIKWKNFANSVGATLTNAVGTKVVSGLDNLFGGFVDRQTDEFGKFAASLVKIFAQAVARMVIEAEAAKLADKLLGGLGGGFLGFLGGGLGLLGLFLQEGGIVSGENAINKPLVVFEPKKKDKVPAMLGIGEAVIPEESVRNNRELVTRLISSDAPINMLEQINNRPATVSYFQTGGIASSEVVRQQVEPIVINGGGQRSGVSRGGDTVNVNVSFQINAIDSSGVADFVQSREFRLAISETINNSLLNLKAGTNRVEAIY